MLELRTKNERKDGLLNEGALIVHDHNLLLVFTPDGWSHKYDDSEQKNGRNQIEYHHIIGNGDSVYHVISPFTINTPTNQKMAAPIRPDSITGIVTLSVPRKNGTMDEAKITSPIEIRTSESLSRRESVKNCSIGQDDSTQEMIMSTENGIIVNKNKKEKGGE